MYLRFDCNEDTQVFVLYYHFMMAVILVSSQQSQYVKWDLGWASVDSLSLLNNDG